MEYTEFGKTGLKVSRLCLGTWGIGGYGWDANPDDVRKDAIREALRQGINFFDTAPAYNAGAAERLLGDVLAETGERKNVIISTKCGNDLIDGQYVQIAKRDYLLKQIDRSLENLRTDYIDVYFLHWPAKDGDAAEQEALETMEEIRKSGKVRFLGLSNHSREQCEKAMTYAKIDALQMQFSALVEDNVSILDWGVRDQGLGTMGYGPLAGGILTGRYREARTYGKMDNRSRFYDYYQEPLFSKAMKVVKVLDEISANHGGAALSDIILCWTARKRFLSTVIFGTQKASRVIENCRSLDLALSEEEMRAIDRAAEAWAGEKKMA
jgi:aryl-alcohol dehydrogenase-like predicted oxidoreductase